MLSEDNFSHQVWGKAERAVQEGRVEHADRALWLVDNGRGSTYRVRYGGSYSPSCSCPHGRRTFTDPACYHMAAVVMLALEEIYAA